MMDLEIKSKAFKNNEMIPEKYTCEGDDISPPLEVVGIPKTAKSLVLLVEDPDAPNGTFIHWVVFDISPESAKSIGEDKVPGSEGLNDFGKNSYGGPCPPSGTHRYVFKVFALNKKLNLPTGATIDEVHAAMDDNIIAKGELVGLYIREEEGSA